MARIDLVGGNVQQKGDANGTAFVGLYDSAGNPIAKLRDGTYLATDRFIPMAGLNDNNIKPMRVDRLGSLATAKMTPWSSMAIESGHVGTVVPSNYAASATTQTFNTSVSSGIHINSTGVLSASSHASITSLIPIPKYARAPIHSRARVRLSSKGGTNAQADIHALSNITAVTNVVIPFGYSFAYLPNGELKAVCYYNSVAVQEGSNIAPLIQTDRYYLWDIILDDDFARFIIQDTTTANIIYDQTFNLSQLEPRIGQATHWHTLTRTYVGAVAATGAPTQLFFSDEHNSILDLDSGRSWDQFQAGNFNTSLISPVLAFTSLSNNSNSVAPASATLSNTSAGYGTLGGQFQFAAVAGAETDYCLFAYQVPSGYSLEINRISIDVQNTGAAVATTDTALQWSCGFHSSSVSLASSVLRHTLGMQSFPIGSAIGAQAQSIRELVNEVIAPGRYFQLILKMPRGTATASQILRGVARIDGKFS